MDSTSKDLFKLKKRLFKEYYNDVFRLASLYPADYKFRHFRVEIFSRGKRRFERLKDVFYNQDALKKRLIKIVPKNAYFTPVKWLNPIYVSKTRGILDVLLSSPLFFDIDYKHLNPPTFENALLTTGELCDYLFDEYGKKSDKIIFSGRQGFHVHYNNWDDKIILKESPENRIINFIKKRKTIVNELHKKNIFVDPTVTTDPYRIIKISHTLHGDTGLIASPVNNIKCFTPLKDSVYFSLRQYEEVFSLDFSLYEI